MLVTHYEDRHGLFRICFRQSDVFSEWPTKSHTIFLCFKIRILQKSDIDLCMWNFEVSSAQTSVNHIIRTTNTNNTDSNVSRNFGNSDLKLCPNVYSSNVLMFMVQFYTDIHHLPINIACGRHINNGWLMQLLRLLRMRSLSRVRDFQPHILNIFRPSDAYRRGLTKSSLVQVMVCRCQDIT